VVVVQNGLNAGEALGADDLLAVQRAIRLAELRVALVRELAKVVVEGHENLLVNVTINTLVKEYQ